MKRNKFELQQTNKLWGGRFTTQHISHFALDAINRSINVDRRLYEQDIEGSVAYASALKDTGILSETEMKTIHEGLRKVQSEWRKGTFNILPDDEDVHTANERRLSELVGVTVGAKLHTGRSRNDQVSTDTRLWLHAAAADLTSLLLLVIEVMAGRANEDMDVLMPGFTHLQRAQPVRWSHWLLNHAWSLRADTERLENLVSRAMSAMPLGSGALAGTPLNIDRVALAHNLGFTGVSNNSMHAVADRDFVAEFVFWASLTGVHLSRLAEDLILFNTTEFGYVQLDETLATGSSLMPHKRNPDGLELVRAKSATISGQCAAMLSLLKGLPSTYNKDLQEDKAAMFAAHDDLKLAINIVFASIQGVKVTRNKCSAGLSFDMLATDLAYYLVRKGMPFREAHHTVGKAVHLAEQRACSITELALKDLQAICPLFDDDVAHIWNFESSVEQYQAVGGTCRSSVCNQIVLLQNYIEEKRIKKVK